MPWRASGGAHWSPRTQQLPSACLQLLLMRSRPLKTCPPHCLQKPFPHFLHRESLERSCRGETAHAEKDQEANAHQRGIQRLSGGCHLLLDWGGWGVRGSPCNPLDSPLLADSPLSAAGCFWASRTCCCEPPSRSCSGWSPWGERWKRLFSRAPARARI